MSFHKYTAPIVFTQDRKENEQKVVITNGEGKVLAIEKYEDHDQASLNHIPHAIIPGFINTHCHLELSHMKNLVDTGTTLLPFISSVVKYRDFHIDDVLEAIQKADQAMYNDGIVAVGDISNKNDTLHTKRRSKIRYYTFVEMFDLLNPQMTSSIIDQYAEVYAQHDQNEKDAKSMVPHAPYSVTNALFAYINKHNEQHRTISIHNEETLSENELFLFKTGGFIDFYKNFGNDLSHFNAIGKSAIHYAIANMDANQKTIFVHNTQTNAEGIDAAYAWNKNIYWATCPNANLYIENRLPNYKLFIDKQQKMTIGTDSLTSNWQLSIWEEMKTLHKYCSFIPIQSLIKWATINGAEALGFENQLGSIEVGKTPGLISVPISSIEGKLIFLEGNPLRIDPVFKLN